MPVVVFLLFAGLVVVVIVVSYIYNKKKQEELAAWGAQQGLQFSARDQFDIPKRFGEFGLMQQGHSHSASDVLWKEGDGREVLIFEYSYKTGSGKDESTHTCCACSWQLPVALGGLVIRPEGFFDHVAAWFGHDRIEFESTEFNKRYHVAGSDKRQVYDVITPQMMEFIMERDLKNLEVRGRTALGYLESSLNLERGQWLLEVSEGFTQRLPGHVISASGSQG
jgi:hypothetical protein